jgi:hypothetical protein
MKTITICYEIVAISVYFLISFHEEKYDTKEPTYMGAHQLEENMRISDNERKDHEMKYSSFHGLNVIIFDFASHNDDASPACKNSFVLSLASCICINRRQKPMVVVVDGCL